MNSEASEYQHPGSSSIAACNKQTISAYKQHVHCEWRLHHVVGTFGISVHSPGLFAGFVRWVCSLGLFVRFVRLICPLSLGLFVEFTHWVCSLFVGNARRQCSLFLAGLVDLLDRMRTECHTVAPDCDGSQSIRLNQVASNGFGGFKLSHRHPH